MTTLLELVIKATKILEEKSMINEELLINLVQALIKSESKPGGPYLVNKDCDLILNTRILKLFVLLNKPLPNVERYIETQLSVLPNSSTVEVKRIFNEITAFRKSRSISETSNKKNVDRYIFYELFLNTLSPEVYTYAREFGNKIIKVDMDGEITDFAKLFHDGLSSESAFTKNALHELGNANFMTWVAYSIYDSVIDEDIEPGALSGANIIIRHATEIYRSVLIDFNIVLDRLQRVDSANSWETKHCRFSYINENIKLPPIPNEKNMEALLKDRAIAHIIGPLAIASRSNIGTATLQTIEEALEHYCIARQLNDDLHDWVEDFHKGRITFVLARLLRESKIHSEIHDEKSLVDNLKKIFYEKELISLCKLIECHTEKSITLLAKSGFEDGNNQFIKKFIKPIEHSAMRARQTHKSNQITTRDITF